LERWAAATLRFLASPSHRNHLRDQQPFLKAVREQFPGDDGKVTRMSIIDEAGEKFVRMAHLACIGSKHINGVAELHTQLLRDELLRDFHDCGPTNSST
jgi:starch phosphorylase